MARVQGKGRPPQSALAGQRAVEGQPDDGAKRRARERRGRVHHLVQRVTPSFGKRRDPPEQPRAGFESARGNGAYGLEEPTRAPSGRFLRRARSGRLPLRLPGRRRLALWRGVEEQIHQLDARDAVHHAMVNLRDEGAPAPRDAPDDVQLPERLAAIEPAREQTRREGPELRVVAGRLEDMLGHVARDVEGRVGFPGRVTEGERRRTDSLQVSRRLVQAGLEAGNERLGRHLAVEDADAADVQRALVGLDVQECGVER
jgi:hypothetical protein